MEQRNELEVWGFSLTVLLRQHNAESLVILNIFFLVGSVQANMKTPLLWLFMQMNEAP